MNSVTHKTRLAEKQKTKNKKDNKSTKEKTI